MPTSNIPKLCLVDASGYIHRAFHALPPLSTASGQPVHAVYGYARMMTKLLKTEAPTYLGVCFDTPKPTFRHEMHENYKGTRQEIDNALLSQLPLVSELTAAWGLPCIKLDGFEADDVIATLTTLGRAAGCEVLILTGDKDMLQLVEPGVTVRDEIRKVDFDAEKVRTRFGVGPTQIVDFFSLMGDKIDNVPGVPGVGEKTAAKLLEGDKSLEDLFASLDSLKPGLRDKLVASRATVFNNRNLIGLKKDVPLHLKIADLKPTSPDKAVLGPLLQRLEFRGDLLGGEAETVVADQNKSRVVRTVSTMEDLAALERRVEPSRVVSYDLETDSADEHHCGIVGVALSTQKDEAWYIPIGHKTGEQQLSWKTILPFLKRTLEDSSRVKVGQNLKFDNAVLARHGVFPIDPFFDTMIALYCLEPGRNSYGLKDSAAEFVNERMTRIEEFIGKGKAATMADVPVAQVAPYAGADAEVALRLKNIFEERLTKENVRNLFDSIEMPLVKVLQAMEAEGIRVDRDQLVKLQKDFDRQRAKIEEEIYAQAGEKFLISSPQQLGRILFEKLKLPVGKKNKTGFSTNEEVLKKLSAKHPICEKIIAYRELSKLTSTYVLALQEAADPTTGRVHTSFHQTGAATGRLSSTDPNLQNIPIRSELGRSIRRAFVAEPGWSLVSADYSQIDLRSLAHMTGDPVLVETFKKGGDIHAATAAEVFHVAASQVTPEMRRRAKAINFGVVYGQQAWGLSQSLGIPVAEAEEFIKKYFDRYAGVKTWIESTLASARIKGFVETWAGRRRPVPDILSENQSTRGFAERIAVNTPIQGTSADIIKIAMIHLHHTLREKNLRTRMLVQVHDELLFEVPKEERDAVLPLIRDGMEKAADLAVPLAVDIKVGESWTEMEKVALEKVA